MEDEKARISYVNGWHTVKSWRAWAGQDRESRCFFFQAEDGIRDYKVTGVQTCALPIWAVLSAPAARPPRSPWMCAWSRFDRRCLTSCSALHVKLAAKLDVDHKGDTMSTDRKSVV